jgi:hypothetical protein
MIYWDFLNLNNNYTNVHSDKTQLNVTLEIQTQQHLLDLYPKMKSFLWRLHVIQIKFCLKWFSVYFLP